MADKKKSATAAADDQPAESTTPAASSTGVSAGDVVMVVLASGQVRPAIVVDVVNADNPRPTVHATMFTKGKEDGHESHNVYYQGRYSEQFEAHSWHLRDQLEPKELPDPVRPVPAVGDRVTVEGAPGVISKVEGDAATEITLDDGTTVSEVAYIYADQVKAEADAAWQAFKNKPKEANA